MEPLAPMSSFSLSVFDSGRIMLCSSQIVLSYNKVLFHCAIFPSPTREKIAELGGYERYTRLILGHCSVALKGSHRKLLWRSLVGLPPAVEVLFITSLHVGRSITHRPAEEPSRGLGVVQAVIWGGER